MTEIISNTAEPPASKTAVIILILGWVIAIVGAWSREYGLAVANLWAKHTVQLPHPFTPLSLFILFAPLAAGIALFFLRHRLAAGCLFIGGIGLPLVVSFISRLMSAFDG